MAELVQRHRCPLSAVRPLIEPLWRRAVPRPETGKPTGVTRRGEADDVRYAPTRSAWRRGHDARRRQAPRRRGLERQARTRPPRRASIATGTTCSKSSASRSRRAAPDGAPAHRALPGAVRPARAPGDRGLPGDCRLAVLASGLLISPVVLHRVLFRQHARRTLISAGQRFALAGFVTLGLAVVGVCALIFDVVLGVAAGAVAAVVSFLVFAVLWAVWPMCLRKRVGRGRGAGGLRAADLTSPPMDPAGPGSYGHSDDNDRRRFPSRAGLGRLPAPGPRDVVRGDGDVRARLRGAGAAADARRAVRGRGVDLQPRAVGDHPHARAGDRRRSPPWPSRGGVRG